MIVFTMCRREARAIGEIVEEHSTSSQAEVVFLHIFTLIEHRPSNLKQVLSTIYR